MKTIEEEAKEFSNTKGIQSCKLMREVEYDTGRFVGFKAGAKFAQRWTPIDANNLPEVDGKYLVLRSNGDWTSTYFQKSTNSFANYYSDLHYFTHWRQIEIK